MRKMKALRCARERSQPTPAKINAHKCGLCIYEYIIPFLYRFLTIMICFCAPFPGLEVNKLWYSATILIELYTKNAIKKHHFTCFAQTWRCSAPTLIGPSITTSYSTVYQRRLWRKRWMKVSICAYIKTLCAFKLSFWFSVDHTLKNLQHVQSL
jgi:hypothetical protein